MFKYNVKIKVLLFMLFLFTFFSIFWMLGLNNSLTFDDFSILYLAKYTTFDELFHFFPTQTYNDRPMGLMLVKALNILFNLNYQNYHIIYGVIHLINVYLVYKISSFIFAKKEDESNEYYSIIASAIFGIYPISLMSVSWISAIFDILCVFFILLSFYFYLKSCDNKKYNNFYGILSIIFYYFAIRTKEMALTLPLIIIVYELWKALANKKRIRLYWYVVFEIIMMVCFVFLLFKGGIEDISPDNPYYQSFNVINLMKNATRYVFLYFDWGNSGFSFSVYSKYSIAGVLFFVLILLFSMFSAFKKKDYSILLSIVAIGISISVVLTMVNMQHRLYLYFPSVLIGITVAVFLYKFSRVIHFKYLWELAAIIIPCLYLFNFTPGMISYREMWLNYCKQDFIALEQLNMIQKPINSTNVYVKGALDNYNIFYYGPGNSLKLTFDDPTINTILVDEYPVQPETPYVFLEYNNNVITEVKRDMTLKVVKIESVYPDQINESTAFNEDGSLSIGVVCNEINNNQVIIVNGEELITTIGTDFISAIIPKELLKQQSIEVTVKDTNLITETEKVSIKNNN